MTTPALPILATLIRQFETIVLEAGARALEDYRADEPTRAEIIWKTDNSPVTTADLALDRLIGERLAALHPDDLGGMPLHFHSEERKESWTGHREGLVAVLDPIDGTRAFMKGRDDWCIALGLLYAGRPVAGVIGVPARGEMFAAHHGGGARFGAKPVRIDPPSGRRLTVAGPPTTVDALRTEFDFEVVPNIAALAHRLVRPLAGGLDLALARGGGHDWDLVAADCILAEAGGVIGTDTGEQPVYHLKGGVHPALRAGNAGLVAAITPSGLTERPSAAKGGA